MILNLFRKRKKTKMVSFEQFYKDYIIEDVKELLDCKDLNITDVSLTDLAENIYVINKKDIFDTSEEGYVILINTFDLSNLPFNIRLDREYKLNQLII